VTLAGDRRPGVLFFGVLGYPFWYDGDPVGGVFGLLSVFGGFFTGGWFDPPSPLTSLQTCFTGPFG